MQMRFLFVESSSSPFQRTTNQMIYSQQLSRVSLIRGGGDGDATDLTSNNISHDNKEEENSNTAPTPHRRHHHRRRAAIITGGTRGIGRGITEKLALSGEYSGFLLSYNTNQEQAEVFAAQLRNGQYSPTTASDGDGDGDDVGDVKVEIVGGDVSRKETRDLIFDTYDKAFGGGDDDDEEYGDFDLGAVIHNAGQYVGVTSDNADGLKEGKFCFGDGSMLIKKVKKEVNDDNNDDDDDDKQKKVDLEQMHYYQRLYGDAYIDLCERGLVRMKAAAERSQSSKSSPPYSSSGQQQEKGSIQPYRGSLIGISSPGCNLIYRAAPGYDMPGSGKCIMEYSNRLFAIRAAKYGINCNVVIPGFVVTDAWGHVAKNGGRGDRDAMLQGYAKKAVPMGEVMTPGDIGDMVAFLCGSGGGGRFVTGLSLRVDAGLHLTSV